MSQFTESEKQERLLEVNENLTLDFKSRFPSKYKIKFSERNAIVAKEPIEIPDTKHLNISKDILNEVLIYNQAMKNCQIAIEQWKKENLAIFRPKDFYAEMFKSDQHMDRVQQNLEHKQKKLEDLEKKKQVKIQQKYQKQMKHQNNLEFAKQKKSNLQAIDKWKNELKKKGNSAKDLNSFMKSQPKIKHKFEQRKNKIKKSNKNRRKK